MYKDDVVRFQHMLDAAREAAEFMRGRTRTDLDRDRKLTLALVKDLEIMGEAAYRISRAMRDSMPGIPWDDRIGMRHRLVHAYFDIDLDILWETAQKDRSPLIAELDRITQGNMG
jgi:uncharacterized protein with HEPN domain